MIITRKVSSGGHGGRLFISEALLIITLSASWYSGRMLTLSGAGTRMFTYETSQVCLPQHMPNQACQRIVRKAKVIHIGRKLAERMPAIRG